MAVNKIKHTFERERDSLSYLLEKTREKSDYEKKLAVSNAITELKEGYEKIKNNLDKAQLQKEENFLINPPQLQIRFFLQDQNQNFQRKMVPQGRF